MNIREQQIYMGNQFRAMREKAGMSQEDIAAEMNRGRGTVIRTEAGESDLIRYLCSWLHYCQVTNQDPVRSTLRLLFPEQFVREDADADRTAKIKRLDAYLHNAAPDLIVDEIDNLFYGAHGSDPEALMQAFTAYLHCPLYMRHTVTQQVATNYRQAVRMGLDPIPDAVHPDIDTLDTAILTSYSATMEGRESYSIK